MSSRLTILLFSVLCAACGTSTGGGGGLPGGSTAGTPDNAACTAAKQHLCENIGGQGCSTATMGNAMAKVSAACTAASTSAYFPWVESACSAKTLDCNNLPKFVTPGDLSCAPPKDFSYSGTATADGRSATLDFTIKGTAVSGKLHANNVCQPSIHLTSTDFTFTGTLAGTWEGNGSVITGNWTGGDFDCDGKIMAGYPTAGSVTILQTGTKISLKRISNGWEYAFTTSGQVYSPPACTADTSSGDAGKTD